LNRINPWLIVILLLAGVWFINGTGGNQGRNSVPYNTFLTLVEQGKVESVTITENVVDVRLKQQERVTSTNGQAVETSRVSTLLLPSSAPDQNLIPLLTRNGVDIIPRNPSNWLPLIVSILPAVVLIGFFYFILMRSQGAQGQVMQFGQSRAKMYGKERRVTTTFADVAGHEEVKRELVEVVDFLKNPGKYHAIGAEIPKGVLLVGPPGTGKTLLARAVSGEAGVPFFTVSASEFMEMFVGVGASRVRSLFEDARKAAPAIIFIDELDSIGRKRGAGIGGGHDEREQTLNQILSEMDGFDKTTSVIILAATNRPDILDAALLRPGRFDRQVTVGLPNVKEREAILRVHMRNKPIGPDVKPDDLAKSSPGMSGADLRNLVNESALEAARRGSTTIAHADFSRAFDKIILGLERGSLVLTDQLKRTIAYHEAGHAVVAEVIPEASRVSKVTIVPRGMSLGVTVRQPEETAQVLVTKEHAEAELSALFGGRAAEEMFIGTVSSGAQNDFQRATDLAKRMVLDWGMGDRFKNIAWGGDSGPVFLGEQMMGRKDYSEDTARLIDEDIKDILERTYTRTRSILKQYASAMHEVAAHLLRDEIIPVDLVRDSLGKVAGLGTPTPTPAD
jgi:cell division protease FtsH